MMLHKPFFLTLWTCVALLILKIEWCSGTVCALNADSIDMLCLTNGWRMLGAPAAVMASSCLLWTSLLTTTIRVPRFALGLPTKSSALKNSAMENLPGLPRKWKHDFYSCVSFVTF